MYLKAGLFFSVFLLSAGLVFSQDLSLESGDFRIEQRTDGGFHLYIRKKPDIGSVLLAESTRDPLYRESNYAYRAATWNSVNGDEIRILDGQPIRRERQLWSLIDSTPENHPELGEAFHIFIPWILEYGAENTRHGEVYVVSGAYFNVRAFSLPYGDYRGAFKDNPFTLEVLQQPQSGPPEGNYMMETVETFSEIAGGGTLEAALGAADLTDKIKSILEKEKGKTVDAVICFDATGSMGDDVEAIREMFIPMLRDITAEFPSFRIGMVLYKDYFEEYITRVIPFTADLDTFQKTLDGIRTGGGRDIPEAVHEALYEAAVKFTWEAESRQIILIGDAPPHPRPRGRITGAMVKKAAGDRSITLNAIILPQ